MSTFDVKSNKIEFEEGEFEIGSMMEAKEDFSSNY